MLDADQFVRRDGRSGDLPALLRQVAEPLPSPADAGAFGAHFDRYGDARVVLKDSAANAATGERAVVMGREGPLSQVIRNLIENARSFSPPNGEVVVTLARVNSLQAGPMLRLTVEDQGPGIPPDKFEKIFDRFYTDRPQGAKFGNNSGLGLSIVRQIVETHRGRVWAENRVVDGNVAGARFTVDLPPAPDV